VSLSFSGSVGRPGGDAAALAALNIEVGLFGRAVIRNLIS
jgi:hypothetical protein